jgi:hypothetical protein
MAVIATHLTTSGSGTGATSYNTASISPTTNRLVLVFVRSAVSSGSANTPTISGAGLTFDNVFAEFRSGGTISKISVFRAQSPSPSSGALTIDFGGQTQTLASWTIAEFSNVPIGNNGSGALVTSNIVSGNPGSAATSLTITLNAFQNSLNATFGAISLNVNTAITQGGGFSELGEFGNTSPDFRVESEFVNTNDTSVDWSFASATAHGVALEIREISTVADGSFLFNYV